MAIDFPSSPTLNQTLTSGLKTWQYDGEKWVIVPAPTTLDSLSNVEVPTPTSGDYLKYNGTSWVNDAIDLGTDTTGSYVQSLVAGTGITLSNNSGEGATPTVAIGQAVETTSTVTFGSVTAGGVTAGVVGSTTISTDSGDLTIAPASLATTIIGDLTVGTISPFFVNAGDLTVANDSSFGGNVWIDGPLRVEAIREKIIDGSIVSNNMTCDHFNAGIFYVTNPSANFTANVTNLSTDDGFTGTVSIFVQQGATGYYPSALQIAGTGQTIKWSGGTAPTPTSSSGKIDLFTFTMIRRSSTWTVLGSANLNY